MVLTIGGKEYTFEFSIEASLYSDCTERVITLMTGMFGAEDDNAIKKILSSIADVPGTTMVMFYAGLMEHHSEEITSLEDAKALVKTYLLEHKKDGNGNFYALMELMIEQMENDDFFGLIGLDKVMKNMEKAIQNVEEEQKPQVKVPQDHKKKSTTTKKRTTTTKAGEK